MSNSVAVAVSSEDLSLEEVAAGGQVDAGIILSTLDGSRAIMEGFFKPPL